ncbi:MAG: hypothetical protein RLZZ385_1001 [Pseudomonadota bacterium]|jgi:glutathione S-transferase
MKLVIGNKNYSSWSLRAWLLLHSFKVPFEEIKVPLYAQGAADHIKAYSKAAKVPVLHDGNLVVWDSLAICEYVNETYLTGQAWPSVAAARAQARSAAAEMHSSFQALRSQMPMNCRAAHRRVPMTDILQKDIRRIDELWNDLHQSHGGKGKFLCGDFSIVDCMFAPVVFRFNTYGAELSTFAEDYVATLLNLASMQQWLADARLETAVIVEEEVGLP